MVVSPLHPGVFIPRSGLDHPLYDSVFANAGSSSELQDERTIETRLTGVRHPAIMIESSLHEDNIIHAVSSQELSSYDDQTAQLHVLSSYDINRSVTSYRHPGDNVVSSDHSTSVNDSLPDNASFVFYDKRPTD